MRLFTFKEWLDIWWTATDRYFNPNLTKKEILQQFRLHHPKKATKAIKFDVFYKFLKGQAWLYGSGFFRQAKTEKTVMYWFEYESQISFLPKKQTEKKERATK